MGGWCEAPSRLDVYIGDTKISVGHLRPAKVDFGVWRCIVSEGANQLTIRPKITELKDAQGKFFLAKMQCVLL